MKDSDRNSIGTNWGWELSFEVASYTLLLDIFLSVCLNLILISISVQTKFQILGSPYGTAILGASEVFLLIPVLIYSKKFSISRDQLGIRFGNWTKIMKDVVLGVTIGILMVPISMISSELNELVLGPQPQSGYIKGSLTASSLFELSLLLFSIVFVVVPVEETIIRGFIQQGFEGSFGSLKGLVSSSLIFAFMHLDAWSILPLMVLGMMLGLCFRLRHNRLLAPIISHALYMVYLVASVSF
jgi:membrane protease YdiL (CAAX protease family)